MGDDIGIWNIRDKAAETDMDRWVIVKDLTANTCSVLSAMPNNRNLVFVTTFRAFVMGGRAMRGMVIKECGCQKGCDLKLPS
jgi:hypothetical protein